MFPPLNLDLGLDLDLERASLAFRWDEGERCLHLLLLELHGPYPSLPI